MKFGISTTIATGDAYSNTVLSMDEKLFLTQEIALDFAEKHKLDYVELSILDPYDVKKIDQKRFKDMLSTRSGLKFTAHAPIFEINLGSSSEAWRRMSVKAISDHMNFCDTMNIENLVIHPYRSMGMDQFFLENILLSAIRSANDIAKKDSRVNVLAENLPNPLDLFSDPETLLALENIDYCFDTAHCNCSGFFQSEFISALGKKIKEVHAIDGYLGHPDMHLPIGKGDINFEETKKALEKIKFKGPMILEAFSIEDATPSIKKLKKIFA